MSAEIYFSSARGRKSLLDKLRLLIRRSGILSDIRRGDIVAVKVHVGERGNTRFVRPQFIRIVVEELKSIGAKPFVTDTNTLYRAYRWNAVDHIETAVLHGFTYEVMGAPFIIGDGIKGMYEVVVKVDGTRVKEAYLAGILQEIDYAVVVTHFKLHELTGIGGAMKNVAMGFSSRRGKLHMHTAMVPKPDYSICIRCGTCARMCPANAISMTPQGPVIDYSKCRACGFCITVCPVEAMKTESVDSQECIARMVDYCKAVYTFLHGRMSFLNIVMDVKPECDCAPYAELPIVPDIGILASKDMVAIDKASTDLVNASPGIEGSVLPREALAPGIDKIYTLYPHSSYTTFFELGEKLGLGVARYNLIEVEPT